MQSTNQTRPEEAEVIRVLNQAKDSAELRAVVAFAKAQSDKALTAWQRAIGFEELVKYQQQYAAWQNVVKTILTPLPVARQPHLTDSDRAAEGARRHDRG